MDTPDDYLPALLRQLQAAAPAAAVQLLADAADAHPADARPLLLLAAEFMEQREVDRAEAAYTAALMRAPDFAIARFQLGLLQFTGGRPNVALVTWSPLDQLPADDPLRLFKRGLERLAADDFDGARALLREGMAHNRSNAPLNRDMEMLVARIDAAQPAGAQAGTGSHFLVSTYTRAH